MDTTERIKVVTRIIVSIGSMTITRSAVRAFVNTPTISTKIIVGGTSFVLGSMLGDAAGEYTDKKIDDYKDIWDGKKTPSTLIIK